MNKNFLVESAIILVKIIKILIIMIKISDLLIFTFLSV